MNMLIAVASQNFRTITGHAGKSRRFIVFDVQPGQAPQELNRLDLSKELSIHEYKGDGRHPLYDVDVLIAGSAGPGFVTKLTARGVKAMATAETDPVRAVEQYMAGSLPPPAPHGDQDGCGCNCHGAH